jgi:hypothetical protein
MKNIKVMMLATGFALCVLSPLVMAIETKMEKSAVVVNDAKRGLVKSAHRVEEALCNKGDLTCGAKKVENRTIEAKNVTVDKVKELKNKVN